MAWIELHFDYGGYNIDGSPVGVNTDNITAFYPRSDNGKTQIQFYGTEDNDLTVGESYTQVKTLIEKAEHGKMGHWVKISPAGIYQCSECDKMVMTQDIDTYDYCHGCGAHMIEEVVE